MVAYDWNDLTTCNGANGACLVNSIDKDENGDQIPLGIQDNAWTGTNNNGDYFAPSCGSWNSASQGKYGRANSNEIGITWTSEGDDYCTQAGFGQNGLYCFEQPECTDGIDNDGDGHTDWPNDLQCASSADISESS